jgi:hypothetical protein
VPISENSIANRQSDDAPQTLRKEQASPQGNRNYKKWVKFNELEAKRMTQ